jgi:hypothetical protein
MEKRGQLHALARFISRRTAPGTHCRGGLVANRSDTEDTEKRKYLALAWIRTLSWIMSLNNAHMGEFDIVHF